MSSRIAAALLGLTLGWVSACASDAPRPAPSRSDAKTAVASFALTPACAQCAEDAATNVCGPEAQACLADPTCADAGACVQACPVGDALCLAACVQQAQQVLDDLAACVVCEECPAECSGMWACGGAGGGGGSSAGGGSAAGGSSAGGAAPAPSCDGTGDCMACIACAVQGPCMSGLSIECAVCDQCPNDCAGQVPAGLVSCPP